MFYEAKNFESLEKDYYKITQRPITPEEIDQFYYSKMKNLTDFLAIILGHSSFTA
jgi:hypothetical protein